MTKHNINIHEYHSFINKSYFVLSRLKMYNIRKNQTI